MVLPSSNKRRYVVIVNVCRWLLALVLMLSGFLKAVDPVGAAHKLQEYATAFSIDGVSGAWLLAAAVAQAAVEFLIGLYLFLGVYRRTVSFLALVAMSLFVPFSLYVWVSGAVSDCGCFGESIAMSNGVTFAKNVVLLFLAIVAFAKRSLFVRNLSQKTRWVLVLFSWVYIFGMQAMAIMHLPLIDFGPYKVGKDLRAMVEYSPGEYEYVSVYRKDGEDAVFPSDTIPGDGWEFVRAESKLVKPGTEPEISNFSIVDWEYDIEMADELLADTGYVCIVPIENIGTAAMTHIDKINDLYDYCAANNIRFCAVSPSDEDGVLLWVKRTGAEYPVYWADGAMLRSMIRPNPGLVLLKDGVIVGKWAAADIPAVEDLEKAPGLMPGIEDISYGDMRHWPLWVLVLLGVIFFLPLLDVTLVGIGNARRKRLDKKKDAAQAVDEKTSDLN